MARQIIKIGLIFILIMGFVGAAVAQEGKGKVQSSSVMKEVQGEITWMNNKYIAVVYNHDLTNGTEDEILLPIDKDLQLQHKQKLSELAVGDTVTIQYAEDSEEDEQGQVQEKRHARIISFVKPGLKKPEVKDTSEPVSEPVNDTLTIKGTKGD